MSDREQIAALSVAVETTDKARRVGWARAYSAESSRDDLARDVNMLRAERDIMRRAWSFMFGFVQVYAPQAVESLGEHVKAMGAIIDPTVAGAGRIRAQQQVERDEERLAQQAEKERQRKARKNANNRDFKAARQQERKNLIERYGFPMRASFLNYLEQYAPTSPGD